ncbi:MAG: amino acid permease [Flavobacteriaceae bacterium]|nr:amino acid permease [Flavobacteriaceae bacterium]|tara:strand:- start:11917 stop:12975 length:1059 start_codon:yes stop_codon:yes gene_type:complete
MLKNSKLTVWISAIPLLFIIKYAKENPSFTEAYYSKLLYPWVFEIHRIFFNKFPFSFGDILYLTFALLIINRVIRKSYYWYLKPLSFLNDLGVVLILFLWIFHLSWGLNYHRLALSEQLGISTDYNLEELTGGIKELIVNVNQLQTELVKVDSLPVIPNNSKSFFLKSTTVYHPTNPSLTFESLYAKRSLFSIPLSYMGYAGYLNPFTLESQINSKIPTLNLITTTLHETAHQMGYASEKEANFIAYQSAIKNDNPYIRYAGYSFALRYFFSELNSIDRFRANHLAKKINSGVLKNFKETSDFWKKYENPFEMIFEKIYDTFLKANGEQSGLKSYDQMVGLVINYHKNIEEF